MTATPIAFGNAAAPDTPLNGETLIYAKTDKKMYHKDELGIETSMSSPFPLTASRAVVTDSSGGGAVATTTAAEIDYVNGVTSAIQTQIDGKEPAFTTLPISKGGTNNSSLPVTAGGVIYTDGAQLQNIGAGSSMQIIQSNGVAAPSWATLNIPGSSQISLFDEFMSSGQGGDIGGDLHWFYPFSGTGSNVLPGNTNGDQTHWGTITLTTGTTAAGATEMNLATGSTIKLGNSTTDCEWLFYINNLSDGTNTWKMRIGLGDTGGTGDQANGIYFVYDSTVSANWIRASAASSTRTETASSTAVATGWNKLKVSTNLAASTITYYVNGVSIGTNTTNIPTLAIRPQVQVFKTVGTAARSIDIDYFSLVATMGTSR